MLTAAQVLAENNFGDTRTGGLAGPMGLFLILLLATATILLIRNMNARLRRLPDRFPQQSGPTDPTRADAAVADPTDGTAGRDSSTPAPNGHQQQRNG
ncbi:hypothetical protein LADH09A_002471 [Micromonospora sp. LAH09]|uniref:hypothetical protein n=1 Tax=Micromonospora cabrerizensis TaxID=2911213 RepID=UPI001EE7F422|nr:hypothetical protein [Micromonospora cabrerizensis]MCG5468603.1 hypothetical protein [Micromonospora cabrerizensis]